MDWGEYTEGQTGGAFVKQAEFNAYLAAGTVIAITAVREGHSEKYNKDQFLVDFIDDAGNEKTKGFTKGNAERDSRMRRLQETLIATGEPISARFTKVGNRNEIVGA
jgi:hypothetical protein